jgi:surface polysaccharide O-acyltransferase-like enzyme
MRVIALVMIVLMHSPMPKCAQGFVLSGISYLTTPGIGLFFMISGALLLGNDLSAKAFLKRRFSKILFPTLFWTVFYLIIKCFSEQIAFKSLLGSIFSIPLSAQGHGILWFMYTLAGLYLLTPILTRWLKTASKKEVEFYLLLWVITLIYPYLELILLTNKTATGILYYFAGYSGYFLLGYYLNRYYRFRIVHVIIAVVIAISIPALLYISSFDFDFYSLLWYLSLPVALMAFVWFVLINKTPNKQVSVIGELSRLSFGVYFIHIFIMRCFLWKIDFIKDMPGLVQIPVITLSTLFVSILIVKLISRLPFSKFIIGV